MISESDFAKTGNAEGVFISGSFLVAAYAELWVDEVEDSVVEVGDMLA